MRLGHGRPLEPFSIKSFFLRSSPVSVVKMPIKERKKEAKRSRKTKQKF